MKNPNVFIDGSRGGAKILHFHAVFGINGQTIGWYPSLRAPPFWEILDLLLALILIQKGRTEVVLVSGYHNVTSA